jgi:UrcA family protein
MTRNALCLLAALIGIAPSVVPAAPPTPVKHETVTGTVTLAGLDLSTPEGSTEARKRLKEMSKHLCRAFQDDRKVSNRETYADCVHDTLARALERLDGPTIAVAKNQQQARKSAP